MVATTSPKRGRIVDRTWSRRASLLGVMSLLGLMVIGTVQAAAPEWPDAKNVSKYTRQCQGDVDIQCVKDGSECITYTGGICADRPFPAQERACGGQIDHQCEVCVFKYRGKCYYYAECVLFVRGQCVVFRP